MTISKDKFLELWVRDIWRGEIWTKSGAICSNDNTWDNLRLWDRVTLKSEQQQRFYEVKWMELNEIELVLLLIQDL